MNIILSSCKNALASEALIPGLIGALGLFFGMANPFFHLPLLALLFPVSLQWLGQTSSGRRQAFVRGWLTGMTGAAACLYWIAVPVIQVVGQHVLIGAGCALAVGCYVGLYGGLFGLLAYRARFFGLRRAVLAWALGWFLLEALRGWLFTGFPWLPLAAAFVPWTAWIQPAAWIGAYALGGLLAAFSCLAVQSLRARQFRTACLGLFLLALIPISGNLRLVDYEPGGKELRVALAQGNIDQNQKWDQRYQDMTLALYAALSRGTGAALVVWPETSVPLDYPRHELSKLLRRYASDNNIWLLFGAPGSEGRPGRENLFNRAWLISPLGRNKGMYEKEHLVPFGEYVPPFVNLSFLRGLLQGIGDFTPGTRTAPLVLDPADGRVAERLALGILICYETIFPELSRQRVAAGAQILLNISNDAWFGRSSAAEQHVHLSALRAVEQQRWLVRGTNTGISALVDPAGRIVQRSGLFTRETLKGSVYAVDKTTVFFQIFPWLIPAGAAIFIPVLLFPRRKHPKKI